MFLPPTPPTPPARRCVIVAAELTSCESADTPTGQKTTHLESILLNGNNVAMLVPGGKPESS